MAVPKDVCRTKLLLLQAYTSQLTRHNRDVRAHADYDPVLVEHAQHVEDEHNYQYCA